jgi:hypothetical protein
VGGPEDPPPDKPRGQGGEPCTGKLTNACPKEAIGCIYYDTFTEYECECDRTTDACDTENAECKSGYELTRNGGSDNQSIGGGGTFFACDCVDARLCDISD